MVFFNEETERICEELGYELILPPDTLRRRLDSKIVTTELGNEAGAASVPNVLVEVDSWHTLVRVATDAGLGTDLVVQTPYGDSGKTTFFLTSEADWARHARPRSPASSEGDEADQQRGHRRRGGPHPARHDRGPVHDGPDRATPADPVPGRVVRQRLFPEAVTRRAPGQGHRPRAPAGRPAGGEGYRGFFEVDVLIDLDSDEVYLGELNPRISGVSSLTNVTAGAYADVPLFLFHLLEFMDVDYELDVEEINERWRELGGCDAWSQLIMKEPRNRSSGS